MREHHLRAQWARNLIISTLLALAMSVVGPAAMQDAAANPTTPAESSSQLTSRPLVISVGGESGQNLIAAPGRKKSIRVGGAEAGSKVRLKFGKRKVRVLTVRRTGWTPRVAYRFPHLGQTRIRATLVLPPTSRVNLDQQARRATVTVSSRLRLVEDGTEYLGIATSNVYHGAVRRRPAKVYRSIVKLLDRHHVVGLQEFGDGRKLLDRIRRAGFGVFSGNGDSSQYSTPIVYRPELNVTGTRAHFLTPKTRASGAGGDWVKPKWAMAITFRFAGETFSVLNVHGPASTYLAARYRLAKKFFRKLTRAAKAYGGNTVVLGDLNQSPTSKLTAPLRDAAFRSSQQRFGPLVTFPRHRSFIDDIMVRTWGARVAPTELRTFRTPSDHLALGLTMRVS